MKLYQAIDTLDDADSFFLVYPDGDVAVIPASCGIDYVRSNVIPFITLPSERFYDAVNPVLVAEWE